MSYKKTIWEDFVTPLDENNMNNIENGIEHVDQEVHKTQADLRETKNHLAQTDINVATNKQSIIDLDAKHDEDIKNLDDKYTKEINDTNAEVATKLPKQNIDILKDVNIEVSGDQAFITKTIVNLNEDTLEPVEQSATQIIPDATEQQSGLMTKATVKAINQMQEQIEQLQGKTTRLLYTDKTDPTAAEINAFVIAEGYTEPFDGIAVVIDETYHIWHFYEGGVGWKDDGLDTVTTFTNDIAGIIKGSNDDGKVYANEDGTGSVKGWDTVKQNIASNAQAITQRATITELATTNQNLTNLTNHVDDVEEQLQQNITNGDNALDAKITNLNNKTLQLPTTALTKQSVVTITTENTQQNLTTDNFVMTTPQSLTAVQKTQVKVNLDLPIISFDGSYTSLGNKPVLNTDNSIALTTNAAEEINGIMNLHKISKTGNYEDLIGKPTIPTATSELTNDSNFVSDPNYVHTDNNYTSAEKDKLASIENGAQVNDPIDTALSTTSENAVQNKVVTETINNIVNNTTKIANSYGGFAAGANASATSGGAVGNNANADSGGAVGYNAKTAQGFAGGNNARTVDDNGFAIDGIQLGTGTNSSTKTLQVYNDNIYNANTHTLTAENLSLEGLFTALNNIGGGFSISDPTNVGIELGRRDGTEGTPYIDFHTDGSANTDYNARIKAAGSQLEIEADGGLKLNNSNLMNLQQFNSGFVYTTTCTANGVTTIDLRNFIDRDISVTNTEIYEIQFNIAVYTQNTRYTHLYSDLVSSTSGSTRGLATSTNARSAGCYGTIIARRYIYINNTEGSMTQGAFAILGWRKLHE